MKILSYFCLFFSLLCITRYANAEELSISFENSEGIAGEIFTTVYLDGDIDSNSPVRLNEMLTRIPVKSAVSFQMNSNGGNLFAGMELGRIIRKLGASTHIGRNGVNHINYKEDAKCFSACALVYLGGLYRFNNDRTVYGVHRISSSAVPTTKDLDIGQILSAAVSTYISEMGVDAKLFKILASTNSNDIYILSNEEMKELRVSNNGRSPADWEVKIIPGAYYLRGQQETYFGFGKIVLSCSSKKIILMSVYSAGEGKAIDIASGGWIHKLKVDDDDFSLPEPSKRDISTNGEMIISSFILTSQHINKILKAKQIGHLMMPTTMAQFYVGYYIDIEKVDTAKVRDYIQNCI